MTEAGSTWRLWRDNDLLGELEVTGSDFPWLQARFSAQPRFAQVASLFEEELRLLDVADDDVEAWERVYYRLRETVHLTDPDGRQVAEFLLHIDGTDAWWRWSDTPFDAS